MQIQHFMVNNVPSELQGTTPPALCCQMAFKTRGRALSNLSVLTLHFLFFLSSQYYFSS